jgi:hypothetical protein
MFELAAELGKHVCLRAGIATYKVFGRLSFREIQQQVRLSRTEKS